VKSPSVDLDVYNGTVEDLRDWLGLNDLPVPEPPAPAPPSEDRYNQALDDVIGQVEGLRKRS